jgi:uncharacterized membrane protein YcaP (DUF421 family)
MDPVMENLWKVLGIGWWPAIGLVIATTVLFWFFTWLNHVFGQQMRLRVSTASLALLTIIGAITARSILGDTPTMAAGIIALTVLFSWEWVLRHCSSRFLRRTRDRAWPVVRDGVVDGEFLRQLGITEVSLWIRLRRAGVTRLDDVAWAIVESDGALTVIRRGTQLDPELLAGVAGQGLPDTAERD